MSITVTVAVCTLDRPRLLEQTLASLERLRVPDDLAWEVLVVDNSDRGKVQTVVKRFVSAVPLRVVREPRLGLSHARNRSVAEARGRWIVWIDDDVRVSSTWLTAYVEAFRVWPTMGFFGGPIRPVLEGQPPRWLKRAFESVPAVREAYGERNLGSVPGAIRHRDRAPYGGNMAIRKDVLSPRPFDPNLGRRGDMLVGGEELAVLEGLLDEGHEGRWVPGAKLVHVIPPSRQSVAFLRAYFRGQGRVQEPLPEDRPVPTLLGRPRWALRSLLQEEVKYHLLRPLASPERWMPHLIDASFAAGALQGPPRRDAGDAGPTDTSCVART